MGEIVSWNNCFHDDVIKWKHFPRYWPFVRGIHRSPVNSPHKGHWRGAFMFSLICAWINRWVNNSEAGVLRRYRTQYDVIVMTRFLKIIDISNITDYFALNRQIINCCNPITQAQLMELLKVTPNDYWDSWLITMINTFTIHHMNCDTIRAGHVLEL